MLMLEKAVKKNISTDKQYTVHATVKRVVTSTYHTLSHARTHYTHAYENNTFLNYKETTENENFWLVNPDL
jgi:hypothetical protein